MGMGFVLGRLLKVLAQRFQEKDERATALGVELKEQRLLTEAVAFMTFHGEQVADDRLEASWSELSDILCERLAASPHHVAGVLECSEMFEIDFERRVVILLPR
jgi:hypothetical protein